MARRELSASDEVEAAGEPGDAEKAPDILVAAENGQPLPVHSEVAGGSTQRLQHG